MLTLNTRFGSLILKVDLNAEMMSAGVTSFGSVISRIMPVGVTTSSKTAHVTNQLDYLAITKNNKKRAVTLFKGLVLLHKTKVHSTY